MSIIKTKISFKWLVGHPKIFSLEERIFNTVCIVSFITLCLEVPFNIFVGLYTPALLCFLGVFVISALYYLSRFKRKSKLGIILFSIICNVLFSVNYFYNSGIYGPNLILFSLGFLLIVAIVPKEQFKIWIPLNLLLVMFIILIEYLNPQLTTDTYNSELSKSIDFVVTYFVVVLLTYFAISYIRANYDYEKNSVIQKNLAIEEQNSRILSQNLILENLNLEKDKLFSIVTHDVRSPLNSIQGYLEFLDENDVSEEERDMFRKQLLEITRDTSAMLTNLVSWSRAQIDGVKPNLINLDVKKTLNNALNIEKNIAAKKGLELKVVSEDDLIMAADANMFEIVLKNLVNNAIKFTKQNGSILIHASRLNNRCLIAIQDSGLGMDEEMQKTLFKLNAVSTYGTNNERGIGLGLLLCKEFTDLQGGKIWFESQKGVGSTFYLSFELINELVAL